MKRFLKGYFGLISDLWRYITEFWVAFWRETYRGTKEHKKGLLAFLSLCFVVLLVLLAIGYKFSETPTFCGICHNMRVYVDSWKTSTHNFVSCAECHYKPGFWNHLKGKWRDGQVSLVLFITGKLSPKPHAEISDEACLREGCHRRQDLRRKMIFKNVAFDHGKHLEQLRRGKKLRCTTCHAQIVQGTHLTVTETDCFICHFYKAGVKGEKGCLSCARCGSCHVQPKGDLIVKGVKFNHKKYIDRGVPCLECHGGINKGNGSVPDNKCVECHHGEPELLTTRFPSEFIHRMHVTDHKIECYRCHTEIHHEISGLPTITQFSGSCKKCHPGEVHFGPREMYAGTGGIGVSETPSTMYLTGIDCTGCHQVQKESEAALFTTRYIERALSRSCTDCHGKGTERMLVTWKRLLVDLENDLNQRIFQVQKELYTAEISGHDKGELRRAERLVNEARHNFAFVLLGKGVHNIEYAIRLLNYARNNTEEAMALLKAGYQPREFETRYTCTSLCHEGIEKLSFPFGKVAFPHGPHVAEAECTECHSPRERHGETYLKNCATCHHGEGLGKVGCADCHESTGNLFYGTGAIGVKDMPGFKSEILGCVDCHQGVVKGEESGLKEVRAACIECHDESYGETLLAWKKTADALIREIEPRIVGIRAEIQSRGRKGEHTFLYTKPFGDAEHNFTLLKKGRPVHNLEYAEAVAKAVEDKLDEVERRLAPGS